MTTTNKRQLRLTFSAILQNNGIDNLKLETQLVDAACFFFDETKKGENPAIVRGNILDGMLIYADKQHSYELMSERIESALRLHPDGGDAWNAVIDHCNQMLVEGQTIEEYAKWLSDDVYNSPKAHHIAMQPRLIITTWKRAFAEKKSVVPVKTDSQGIPESF